MNILVAISLLLFSSCAFTPKEQEEILVHMSEPRKILGKDFSVKFERDGVIGDEIVSIGSTFNYNIQLAKNEAIARLLNNAPLEFKRIIQKRVSARTGRLIRLDDVSLTRADVEGLMGVIVSSSNIECIEYLEPVLNLEYEKRTECRVLASVPIRNLLNTYSFTLKNKYGLSEEEISQHIYEQSLSELSPKGRFPASIP